MKHLLTLILSFILVEAAQAAPVLGQGTWETTLLARDLDGDTSTVEAYYDTVQDITWLADANFAFTSGYSTVDYGLMNWADANAWADSLTLGGYTEWRLPDTVDVGNDGATYTNVYEGEDYGYNITTRSEMASLLFDTLGNLALYGTAGNAQSGWGLTNTGPFSNVQSTPYWSATEYAPDTSMAWRFDFSTGYQGYDAKFTGDYSWAVHNGDIGAAIVPIPSGIWLFITAIVGLLGVTRVGTLRTA